MKLTNENYHSVEARMAFMGSSQYKDFTKCQACALAKCKGEIEEKKTTALLVGSYVDAYFSKEMDEFKANTPDIFTKQGTLKSDFIKADDIIKAIEDDSMMMKYLGGQHQVIMTGIIAGVPFKIKIDSYFPGKAIVDQKIMSSMEKVWVEGEGWKNFVYAWGYDIQAYIYQEVVRQNTIDSEHPNGLIIPFILAVTTKEEVPDKALLQIDQDDIDATGELVKKNAPIFQEIKEGKREPEKCEHCNYCRKMNKVTGIKSFHVCDPYKEQE